jgi:hypothetical protein
MKDLDPIRSVIVLTETPNKYILSVQTQDEILRLTIERAALLKLNADIVDTVIGRKIAQ